MNVDTIDDIITFCAKAVSANSINEDVKLASTDLSSPNLM